MSGSFLNLKQFFFLTTFAFFTVALTCLWTPEVRQLFALAVLLGVTELVLFLIALTARFAVLNYRLERAGALDLSALSAAGSRYRNALAVSRCAGVILAVIFVSAILNKAPEFVYKAF